MTLLSGVADDNDGVRSSVQRSLMLRIKDHIDHGAADQSAPIDLTGRRTAKLVPGCVYNEYPTAGHGLYVTHAGQINADLAEFIRDAA